MGECYVCGERPATDEDHDHTSGLRRGRLCRRCNVMAQDPDLLRDVLAYVEASPIGEPYDALRKRRHVQATKRWRERHPDIRAYRRRTG